MITAFFLFVILRMRISILLFGCSADVNPLMPNGAFNICCPRDCVSRHNGGTSGAPLKPLRVDSALRALSTLRGLRGAPEVPPLCRETQSLGHQMLKEPLGINGIWSTLHHDARDHIFVVLHFSMTQNSYFMYNLIITWGELS